jgi:ABC-type transport system involved in multi-copper enzyme maturation permease subunit
LATLTIFCVVFVGHAQGLIRPEWHRDYNRLLFVTQQFLVIMWILAVVLLGMGGILREKANGISSLTLSLPVSRARLLGVRIVTGVLEAIILGTVPWLTVFILSFLAGMPVVFTQVGLYVLLLVAGGLVYFAMAILVSSLVEGEYTAPAVGFGLVLLSAIIFDAWLRPLNVWRLVTGDFYIDRSTFLLPGHPPWSALVASLSVAVTFFVCSIKVIQKREF